MTGYVIRLWRWEGFKMDGGLWHHLNEKEIWPTQGLCSEWMKFQSRNSCSRGEGRTHFCINSRGRSNGLGWWVKQAVTADLSLFNDLFQRPSTEAIFFFSTIADNEHVSARGFFHVQQKPDWCPPSSNYVAETRQKCCGYLPCSF